jgi:hypothetical protein
MAAPDSLPSILRASIVAQILAECRSVGKRPPVCGPKYAVILVRSDKAGEGP